MQTPEQRTRVFISTPQEHKVSIVGISNTKESETYYSTGNTAPWEVK